MNAHKMIHEARIIIPLLLGIIYFYHLSAALKGRSTHESTTVRTPLSINQAENTNPEGAHQAPAITTCWLWAFREVWMPG